MAQPGFSFGGGSAPPAHSWLRYYLTFDRVFFLEGAQRILEGTQPPLTHSWLRHYFQVASKKTAGFRKRNTQTFFSRPCSAQNIKCLLQVWRSSDSSRVRYKLNLAVCSRSVSRSAAPPPKKMENITPPPPKAENFFESFRRRRRVEKISSSLSFFF